MQRKARCKWLPFLFMPLLSGCISKGMREETEESSHGPDAIVEVPASPALIDNCSVGCPLGGGAVNIYRHSYTLNNNASTKFANWVAYKITKSSQGFGRRRHWLTDPDIPVGETLSPADYKGASAALKIDRGHQANLASMAAMPDWESLNYLSNITPQKADLNQGPWEKLEVKERELSNRTTIEHVYVLTGPLYERYIGTLPGTTKLHTIPSGYWKVIFTGSRPDDGMFASFLMDQDTPRTANFCDYQVTLEEVERRSGLIMWSGLGSQEKTALRTVKGRLPTLIGCS